ncbi:MAG TPA: hypothetical protein VMX18_01380 [Candidatus Bipolaricaulota bacterium]|nr:hypothetical protein [Candidatus Bipolaricaulota bacterium]
MKLEHYLQENFKEPNLSALPRYLKLSIFWPNFFRKLINSSEFKGYTGKLIGIAILLVEFGVIYYVVNLFSILFVYGYYSLIYFLDGELLNSYKSIEHLKHYQNYVFYWLNYLFSLPSNIILQSLLYTAIVYAETAVGSFLVAIWLRNNKDIKFKKKIVANYPNVDSFKAFYSKNDFKEAAKILKEYKSATYSQLIKKYPKKIIDLLVLGDHISFVGGKKLTRMACIKCIEEDKDECNCK